MAFDPASASGANGAVSLLSTIFQSIGRFGSYDAERGVGIALTIGTSALGAMAIPVASARAGGRPRLPSLMLPPSKLPSSPC